MQNGVGSNQIQAKGKRLKEYAYHKIQQYCDQK